jgi:hypothetical protein
MFLEPSSRDTWLPLIACLLQNRRTSTDQLLCFSLALSLVITPTERPMKIEIVVDPARPASLASRVAPAPAAAAATEGAARYEALSRHLYHPYNSPYRSGGRPRRGRGGGARKRNERPAKSAADLDAEMEVSCAVCHFARAQLIMYFFQDYTAAPTAA